MREQLARVDQETRVAVDMALDRGGFRVVTDGEVRWCLEDAMRWVHYFVFEENPDALRGEGGMLGINASTYALWSDGALAEPAPSALEALEAVARDVMHANCPLHRCEGFTALQSRVPVSHEPAQPMVLRGSPGGMTTWEFVDPITIWVDSMQPGDWVQIGTQRFGAGQLHAHAEMPPGYRITDVDHAQRRITIAAEYAQMGLITPRDMLQVLDIGQLPTEQKPPKRSRVPAHVQRHQPRLDGRRRSCN